VNSIHRWLARPAGAVLALSTLALLAGCASTKVVSQQKYTGGPLPRPERILVYDFGSTVADIPPESPLAGQISAPSEPPTADELEIGRELGAEIAKKLAEEIKDMGLPGLRAADQPPPRPTDIVFKGYFVSIDEGSALKRIVIGFGSGSAELKTYVEAYQMTDQGLVRLGSGDIASGSTGGGPGVVVPVIVTIATANPIGLIVGGSVKAVGEIAGTQKIQASAERTAEKIAEVVRPQFEKQGWIED
jgi:hypothetical protein